MTPRAYNAARALAADPSATPNEREQARLRCEEYEARHGNPASNLRPWWTLKISRKDSGVWLGNTAEFRAAVKGLRAGRKQRTFAFEWQTVKDVQDGRVDWQDFPSAEPWHARGQMRRTESLILSEERVMEWGPPIVRAPRRPKQSTKQQPQHRRGSPRKRGKLGDGQLPGCRKVRA